MQPPATAPAPDIVDTDRAPATVADRIADRLTRALAPTRLEVINESGLHAGHMGDDGTGETHYRVLIESAAFAGLSRVARQRLVNAALADLIGAPIHALAMRTLAPGEAS